MDTWVHVVNFVILFGYVALFVMILICTVSLVKILRTLRSRKASGVEVVPDGGDESGFAGVDPQVVAAIAAAVTVMGQSEGKKLVVRSVRRSGGWAEAGRRESAY
jgi:hypothetical protein